MRAAALVGRVNKWCSLFDGSTAPSDHRPPRQATTAKCRRSDTPLATNAEFAGFRLAPFSVLDDGENYVQYIVPQLVKLTEQNLVGVDIL